MRERGRTVYMVNGNSYCKVDTSIVIRARLLDGWVFCSKKEYKEGIYRHLR